MQLCITIIIETTEISLWTINPFAPTMTRTSISKLCTKHQVVFKESILSIFQTLPLLSSQCFAFKTYLHEKCKKETKSQETWLVSDKYFSHISLYLHCAGCGSSHHWYRLGRDASGIWCSHQDGSHKGRL